MRTSPDSLRERQTVLRSLNSSLSRSLAFLSLSAYAQNHFAFQVNGGRTGRKTCTHDNSEGKAAARGARGPANDLNNNRSELLFEARRYLIGSRHSLPSPSRLSPLPARCSAERILHILRLRSDLFVRMYWIFTPSQETLRHTGYIRLMC